MTEATITNKTKQRNSPKNIKTPAKKDRITKKFTLHSKKARANESLTKSKKASTNKASSQTILLEVGTILPVNTIKVKCIDYDDTQIHVSIQKNNEDMNGRILFNQINDDDDYRYYNCNDKYHYDKEKIKKNFPVNQYIAKEGVVIHATINQDEKHIISISLRKTLLTKIHQSNQIQSQIPSNTEVFSLNVGTILPKNSMTITKIFKHKMHVTFSSYHGRSLHKGRIDTRQITDDVHQDINLQTTYKQGQTIHNQGVILHNNKKDEYRISLRPSITFAVKYSMPGYIPMDYHVNVGDIVIGWIREHSVKSTIVHFCNDVFGTIIGAFHNKSKKLPLYHCVCCEILEVDFEEKKIYMKCLDV